MIKTNNGKVQIKGQLLDLLSDFSHITNSLKEAMTESGISEKEANDMLDKSYRLGKMSKEEIQKEVGKLFLDMLGINNDEEEESNE